ncbi:MAG TPA: hypothetical protein VI795_03220 [Patescibacteria group bacterium]|nr:hypothetical protein [Patescibacteria group bacterium]
MQTLILPGYSSKNKAWTDEVAKNLKVDGVIRPFYWAHWTDEEVKFDAYEKAGLIAKHIRGDSVNIIAKSIGTLVTAYLNEIIPDQIEKIIFCGIPVNGFDEEKISVIKKCILSKGNNFIGFQNTLDPYSNFETVKDFGNIVAKERSDHEYPYFDEFNNFLR